MKELSNIAQLQQLVHGGFTDWKVHGDVKATYHDGLVLFNYTSAAQFAGRWNWFERVSRGLILDAATGNLVARPFDKFFNWGEGGRATDAPIINVTEKMDGSLGIAYIRHRKWHVATRGSFVSDQAQWATEWLRRKMADVSATNVTLLFEIIYPENRVVVDYGERAELVLLAARGLRTGEYCHRETLRQISEIYGIALVPQHEFAAPDTIAEVCAALDANQEGYVAEFADGQRFKFKGDAYKELHRLICGLSFKNTLAAVENGTVEQARAAIPDEFLGQFNQWVEHIYTIRECIYDSVDNAFYDAPKDSRKDFAMWVQANHAPLAPYLFAMWDNKDYTDLIYKREFKAETP